MHRTHTSLQRLRCGLIGTGQMGGPLLHHLYLKSHCTPNPSVQLTRVLTEPSMVTTVQTQLQEIQQDHTSHLSHSSHSSHWPQVPPEVTLLESSRDEHLKQFMEETDVIVSVLPKSTITREIVERMVDTHSETTEGLDDNYDNDNNRVVPKRFVDLCSSNPRDVRQMAALLKHVHIDYMDAPVSGGPSGMRNQSLSCVVSGPSQTVEACRTDIFPLFANHIQYVGERVGIASALKLANNTLLAANLLSVDAVLNVLESNGIPNAMAIDFINTASGRSWVTQQRYPDQILPGRFQYGFSLALHAKDVVTFLQMGEALQNDTNTRDCNIAMQSDILRLLHNEYTPHLSCESSIDHTMVRKQPPS